VGTFIQYRPHNNQQNTADHYIKEGYTLNIDDVLQAHGLTGGVKAEGTAVAADVLAGETFINSTGNVVTGDMVDRTTGSYTASGYTSSASNIFSNIPANAYYGVGSRLQITDFDFQPFNIKTGVSVYGLTGTFTADGTATSSDLLTGKMAYVNGAAVNGNVPLKTPTNGDGSAVNHHLAYASEGAPGRVFGRPCPINGRVAYTDDCWLEMVDSNFNSAYFRADVNMFGMQGSIPIRNGDNSAAGSAVSGNALWLTAPTGYYDGNDRVGIADGNFISDNIVSGKNIFGLGGTFVGVRVASGTVTRQAGGSNFEVESGSLKSSAYVGVSGYNFNPQFAIFRLRPGAGVPGHFTAWKNTAFKTGTNGKPAYCMANTNAGADSQVFFYTDTFSLQVTSSGATLPCAPYGSGTEIWDWVIFGT
jgi:hypothetical protein